MIQSLPMHTPDGTATNIAAIAAAFPHCITESRNAAGELVKAVDFDLLRQELSAAIVEGPQERYQLNWPGKRDALLAANAPIAKTLRPDRAGSVAFDTTQNLYIEGDNLDALKLLQETYLGAVKMIYIDPPYNTGHDFVYKDDFAEDSGEYLRRSQQVSEAGERMVANLDSNGRFHSDWLSMMYPRLKLARNLLKDDGVIFISIAEDEIANLKKLCVEVFGSDNFLAQMIWRSGTTAASHFTHEHEYIVCFAKNKAMLPFFKFNGVDSISDRTVKKIGIKNPPSRISFPAGIEFQCENKKFPNSFGDSEIINVISGVFECKNGKLANPVVLEAGWTMKDMIESWLAGEQVIDQKNQKVTKFFFKDNGVLQYEKIRGTIHPKTIVESHTTKQGGIDLFNLFNNSYFSFPKPVSLIQKISEYVCTNKNDIILDFFSGSATTAHAVMQLNAEDGGNRRFILVQLPEVCAVDSEAAKAGYATIAEIGKERIRRAGATISAGSAAKQAAALAKAVQGELGTAEPSTAAATTALDTGFRVLKVDTSNMADVYYTPDATTQAQLATLTSNIKLDRSAEDLLFQVMLDWGVDLAAPIRRTTLAGKTVWAVTEPSGASLLACFDDAGGINDALVRALAEQRPDKVVFRDAGFANDSVKINVEQLFKALSPTTEIRVL